MIGFNPDDDTGDRHRDGKCGRACRDRASQPNRRPRGSATSVGRARVIAHELGVKLGHVVSDVKRAEKATDRVAGKADKADKVAKAEKPEKMEKPAKPEKPGR